MTAYHILLVDDELDFLDLLGNRLRKRGLTVDTASNGPEALAAAKGQRFDAVILDVKMPGMSGIEVLKALRQLDPEARVIMLTGHASLELAAQGMDLGAADYLLKPSSVNELLGKINDVCGGAVRATP